jgi:hypothetical protein
VMTQVVRRFTKIHRADLVARRNTLIQGRCSARAVKRSLSCWKLAMPWASASSRNRSRMYLPNLSCFPRP